DRPDRRRALAGGATAVGGTGARAGTRPRGATLQVVASSTMGGTAVVHVEIWSDIACPWCYVGKRRLETALAGFEHAEDVEVVYRSFELDPSAPPHGHELSIRRIARKYGRSEAEMRQMQQQLMDVAAQEGLALRL